MDEKKKDVKAKAAEAPKLATSELEKLIVAEALKMAAGKHHAMDLVKLCEQHPDCKPRGSFVE